MKQLSRSEAREAGKTHYFTGKPCVNGHISTRYVSTQACAECNSSRSEQKKDWYKKNRNKTLARAKKNYEENREKKIEYACQYSRDNIGRILQGRSERMKRDPVYAARERVRCLIKECIKKSGSKKKSRTSEILGCSTVFFKEHIERQFLKGMSWDNMGEWHIDHIIPISSAATEEEVIELNHYTNLRPLWAADNIRKSNKLEYLI